MYIHHNKFMQKLSDFLVKRKIKNKFIVSQFVSQDVEEEVDGNSPNVLAKVGHPKRPAVLPLPLPKRKPTFSVPFKQNNGTAP